MDKEDVLDMYNGILLSHKEEWNLAICDNMDGPRGCQAEGNKPGRERQVRQDSPCVRNLKNRVNEQTKLEQTQTLNRLNVARREGVEGLGKKGEGTENTDR